MVRPFCARATRESQARLGGRAHGSWAQARIRGVAAARRAVAVCIRVSGSRYRGSARASKRRNGSAQTLSTSCRDTIMLEVWFALNIA
jgi:hypothetical protein